MLGCPRPQPPCVWLSYPHRQWYLFREAIALRSSDLLEKSMYQLDRIPQQPALTGRKACIRGMRVTVGMIVGQISAGHSLEDILADYPYLEREDILQALRYAAWLAEERAIDLAHA